MRAFRAALALGAALALSACISLFPKSDPVQTYRFDAPTAAARVVAPDGPRVGVLKPGVVFPRAAGVDRILTVDGEKTAYIADSRWVAPAQTLFDEAVSRAFDGDGAARLIGRGEAGQAALILRLEVRNFEAAYLSGPKAAPTVVVRLRAALTRAGARTLVDEKFFEARIEASDNRVSDIVEAFDTAVGEVLAQLVTWTDASAAALQP